MSATYRIDQVTPGAGTAGIARHDLIAGEIITLVATAPVGAGVTHSWEILDKIGTTAVLSATTGTTVDIGSSVSAPFGFRVRLTANDNGVITTMTRSFGAVSPNLGLVVPLFAETAPTSNTFDSNDPDVSDDNAVYTDRAGTGVTEQNWRGWAEAYYGMVMAVDGLSVPSSITAIRGSYSLPLASVVGSLVYLSAASTMALASKAGVGTVPVAGLVESKDSPTSGVVIFKGEITGLAGLNPGATYYLGTGGAMSLSIPSSSGEVIQRVGYAKTTTKFLVDIGMPVVL